MDKRSEMEQLFRSSSEEQERIGRNVGHFSVSLFGVDGSGESRRVKLVGTGTFVSLEKSHYILTTFSLLRTSGMTPNGASRDMHQLA